MSFPKPRGWIAVAFLAWIMQASSVLAAEKSTSPDPLERFNRSMFAFNEKFDGYLLRPAAELYTAIMPRPLNQGIHNIFIAISEPATLANDLLQFHFTQFAKDISRLAINLTFGIGGLFDVAERMGLPHFANDFGLTLAYWGYQDSSYLILPFLGPNTIRDGIGIPVDYYGFYVYPNLEPFALRFGILSWFFVDYRANGLVYQPVLDEVALDRYVFVRNAYLQRRAFQLKQIKHLSD